jgi:hypothetical protein
VSISASSTRRQTRLLGASASPCSQRAWGQASAAATASWGSRIPARAVGQRTWAHSCRKMEESGRFRAGRHAPAMPPSLGPVDGPDLNCNPNFSLPIAVNRPQCLSSPCHAPPTCCTCTDSDPPPVGQGPAMAAAVAERHPQVHWWCPQLPPRPRAAADLLAEGLRDWPQAAWPWWALRWAGFTLVGGAPDRLPLGADQPRGGPGARPGTLHRRADLLAPARTALLFRAPFCRRVAGHGRGRLPRPGPNWP